MARSSLIPGFRFHPTDVELVMYYLKRKLLGKKIIVDAVAEVNIYDYGPWDLPDKSSLRNGDLEWYFFCPKSKKYSSGARSNRATENGFWKATGKDRKVIYKERTVATIKTLVFHLGHCGTGQRTDWVMHEYKMEDEQLANAGVVQDVYVLCKVFEKSGSGPKANAQYGAPFYEEAWDDDVTGSQTVVRPDRMNPARVDMNVSKKTASLCITEPDSSALTYSPNETTSNAPNYHNKKLKAVMNVSVNEPSSSAVTFSPDQNIANALNNCNNKLKAPVMTVSINEPGSSSLAFPTNETYVAAPPLNDDVMLFEDLVSFLGLSPEELLNGKNENEGAEFAKTMAPTEDECIYDDLVNIINLDDLNGENLRTDGAAAEYTPDKMMATDDLDAALRKFYAD